MNNENKISIITVCYNSESFIHNTIDSVLNQSYPDIEYIVVDGGSKDKTIEIIKQFEPRFNKRLKWISEPDKGLYDAMNKGIQMATGDIVGLINSDDLFCDPEAIEKVVKVFRSKSFLDGVYADLYYVDQNDTSKIIRHWITGKQKSFRKGWHPAHPTLYLRKNVYERYGYFDLKFGLAADFEIMLRFIERYRIQLEYLPDFLVKMRLGGTTNKNFKNIYLQNIECVKAFQRNGLSVNPILYPLRRVLPKLLQYKK